MLFFEERGKPGTPVFPSPQKPTKTGVPGEKPLGTRTRTNNKLNPLDSESGNRTRATLVGGLRGRQMLNHCAIPAPLYWFIPCLSSFYLWFVASFSFPRIFCVSSLRPSHFLNCCCYCCYWNSLNLKYLPYVFASVLNETSSCV